jgi:hypothetical protein
MELVNSKRLLYTASHVATKLSPADIRQQAGRPTGAFRKASFLKSLSLGRAALQRLGAAERFVDPALDADTAKRIAHLAETLEQRPEQYQVVAQKVAEIPDAALVSFAKLAAAISEAAALAPAIDRFEAQRTISPIGRLYLERIEMYPVGIQRGELVYTVPLAPGETQTVSHKEWSTSSQEFEQIVQDYFESYSERGVAEKTDAAMSTTNEAKHSSALNFGASVSASYGPVSMTTSFGLNNASEQSQSVTESMSKNREVTEKASARSRKEHKVSMKLESKKGVEDSSFKTITNPTNAAVRIDYYRMMRKWRTDLYRYGLRMTYDITIPTPGLRFWAYWKKIEQLDAMIATPFAFELKPEDITDATWAALAVKYGAVVEAPMPEGVKLQISRVYGMGKDSDGIFEFAFPDGYLATGEAAGSITYSGPPGQPNMIYAMSGTATLTTTGPGTGVYKVALKGVTGGQKATFTVLREPADFGLWIVLTSNAHRRTDLFEAWRLKTWTTLRNAAQARYDQEIGRLRERRDRLYRLLAGKDTLSLRRLEREELLRLICMWLFGPSSGFSTAPDDVEAAIDELLKAERKIANDGANISTFVDLSAGEWSRSLLFGETVKFLQQAIEWENLLYFLYPYFWGSDTQATDKFLFEHPDPEHQNFVRAGYARVVVTVRPGFEEDFTRLMESGVLSGGGSSPYIPIAQEIANFAHTNYAGIPPANPEKHARPLLFPQQRKSWDKMQVVIAAIEKYFADNGTYPEQLSDIPGPLDTLDAWGNPLVYKMPGSGNDYDLISLGADGAEGGEDVDADISSAAGASLIGSWFDYTPTSGIDIEANTAPAVIA